MSPVHVLSALSGCEPAVEQIQAAGNKPAELENVKKSNKSLVREIEPITMSEFESIPQ